MTISPSFLAIRNKYRTRLRCLVFEMSIPFNGTRTRSKGLISAVIKHLKHINLQPVKSIKVQFNPFHSKAVEARDILFHITKPKIIATNPRCNIKADIVSDQSEPIVLFNLLSGDNIVCKLENLTSLNILELYNKHITPLARNTIQPENEKIIVEKRKKKRGFKIKPGNKRRGVFL